LRFYDGPADQFWHLDEVASHASKQLITFVLPSTAVEPKIAQSERSDR